MTLEDIKQEVNRSLSIEELEELAEFCEELANALGEDEELKKDNSPK